VSEWCEGIFAFVRVAGRRKLPCFFVLGEAFFLGQKVARFGGVIFSFFSS
jgi:hypothetical protein